MRLCRGQRWRSEASGGAQMLCVPRGTGAYTGHSGWTSRLGPLLEDCWRFSVGDPGGRDEGVMSSSIGGQGLP